MFVKSLLASLVLFSISACSLALGGSKDASYRSQQTNLKKSTYSETTTKLEQQKSVEDIHSLKVKLSEAILLNHKLLKENEELRKSNLDLENRMNAIKSRKKKL